MGSRPPGAHDRAAAPAQGFNSPNATSTDSEASSTVAWEPVRVQKWHLPRSYSCLLHLLVHQRAIWPSVLLVACLSSCCGCSSRASVLKCATAVLTHTAPAQLRLLEQSCASTPLPSQPPAAGDGWCRWPSRHGAACPAASRLHAPSPLIGECFEADFVLHERARLGRGASGAVFRCVLVPVPAGALGGEAAGSLPAAQCGGPVCLPGMARQALTVRQHSQQLLRAEHVLQRPRQDCCAWQRLQGRSGSRSPWQAAQGSPAPGPERPTLERPARRCSAAHAPAGEQYVVKVVALRKYEDRAMVARERRALELLSGAARVVQLRRAYLGARHAHLVFECAPAAVHGVSKTLRGVTVCA